MRAGSRAGWEISLTSSSHALQLLLGSLPPGLVVGGVARVEGAKFANHHVHVLCTLLGLIQAWGLGLPALGVPGGDGRDPLGDGRVPAWDSSAS